VEVHSLSSLITAGFLSVARSVGTPNRDTRGERWAGGCEEFVAGGTLTP